MSLLGSFIGATLGWWVAGPIGAIIGFAVGQFAKDGLSMMEQEPEHQGDHSRGGFMVSLLVLIGAVMKADGKILKTELDFVRRSLSGTFGDDKASEALLLLRDIIKQDIPITEVTHQMRDHIQYSSRLELLHLLYGIALADGELSPVEIDVIKTISIGIGISNRDYVSISNMFYDDTESAYKVLEIEKTARNNFV